MRARSCGWCSMTSGCPGMHVAVLNDGGELQIRDCDSSNGLLVDGQRVKQATLEAGSVVRLGDTLLVAARDAPGDPADRGGLGLVGSSHLLAVMREIIRRVAPSALPVLIRGRDRHRQGTGGGGGAPAERAGRRLRAGQLRGAAGHAGREHAVRPPPRGLHRRQQRSGGRVPARRRRDAVPRRDRGAAAGGAAANCCGCWRTAR